MRLLTSSSLPRAAEPAVRREPVAGSAILAQAAPVAPVAQAPGEVGSLSAAFGNLFSLAKGWVSRLFGGKAPDAAPTPATEPTGGHGHAATVTVNPGDTLFKLAQRTLGDGHRWQELFNANRDQVSNPNLIFPGMVLKVPGADHAHAPAPAPAPQEGSGPTLRKGVSGDPVKKLQDRLRALGHDPGGSDGAFGPKTDAAVKAFQAAQGLEVDGIVGPNTWKKLGIKVEGAVNTGAAPGVSSNELIDMGPGKPKGVRRQGKIIGVNIAANFDRMVAAAAADGVQLRITSGYRSYAEQVHLYNLYKSGKGNIAAKPGTSNHETGDAIDFTNTPGAWAWLKRNSQRFGFKNFDPEPWHYSPTGG
ncbi:MAG: peptidoglycan-binding protein [Candidatus Sericytochromatia bacterium]